MAPPRRFEAPAANRAVLAEPPFDAIPRLVEANRQSLNTSAIEIGGILLRDFRRWARREVGRAAASYTHVISRPLPGEDFTEPLLVAGHQPELSHPGVWVKHFALSGLARRLDGISLNLVVDNDTLKSTALRFPVVTRDPAGVELRKVAFDRFDREEPYEDRVVHDPGLYCSFPERSAEVWRMWGFEPLLPRVWRKMMKRALNPIAEQFAGTRREYEREWGCHNLELAVSWLCRCQSFVHFVRHVLGDLPRFRDVYNAALADYRRRNGIRSRDHPAPNLGPAEAPFWTQSADGRRGRATAKSDPTAVRPRALTLTLFARVGLGDFFIHGIGGGTYDEVTDAIIRDYFELEPPAYQVLSATLHLPLPTFPGTEDDVRDLKHRERDLYWNPQRAIPAAELQRPEVAELLRAHRRLSAAEPPDREGRRERYREFRRIGERLRPLVEPQLADLARQRARVEQEVAANAILRRRDYAWVLYPEDVLRPFLQSFL